MKRIVTFGEIMMRLSAKDNQRFTQANSLDICYGGSESNVAVSLANFGVETSFVTRLPDNDLGLSAKQNLQQYGVQTNHIAWGGDRLGLYFLEHGTMARGSKVIYDRAGSGFSAIDSNAINWVEVFQGASWFHFSGITPGVSKSAAQVCLQAVKKAKELGLTVSVDLNFRQNLWQYGEHPNQVMPEMMKYCDIVMGGAEDLYQYFNILPEGVGSSDKNPHDLASYKSVTDKLLMTFSNIKTIVYSLRNSISASHNKWSALLWEGGKLYQGKSYDITHIVDRVGAGDALSAGIIYGYHKGMSVQDTLEFGIAASCLKHGIPGDVNLVRVEEVTKLMEGNQSGRVER